MLPGEEVIEDYRTLSLSLKGHPVGFLRGDLTAIRAWRAADLATTRAGSHVRVAGLVLVRQRPGSAKGVIFLTVEDETGVANVIVWPKVFEKYRAAVLGGRFLVVDGRLQSESGVIHVVADRLTDRTTWLARLAEAGESVEARLPVDEVAHPVVEIRAKIAATSALTRLVREVPEVAGDMEEMARRASRAMPKGRNFH
jgi:error-prone DNA polymerase